MRKWMIAPVCFVLAIGLMALGSLMQAQFDWWRVWMMLPVIFATACVAMLLMAKQDQRAPFKRAADKEINQ